MILSCLFSSQLTAGKRLAELENKNKELGILVGVADAIGAGKTSLLNALLGFPELLPSSSTEAATATVCRVAWSHDDTPGREFKAEVTFRNEHDVVEELEQVLKAVKDKKEYREMPFDTQNERCGAIEEVTGIISRGISKVCAGWGLDESEIEDMDHTVDSIQRKTNRWWNCSARPFQYSHQTQTGLFLKSNHTWNRRRLPRASRPGH